MGVYLLHFSEPLGNERHWARHYLGYAADLEARLAEHRRGGGARITEVAVERGIQLILVRSWPGGRTTERKLKSQHRHPRLCPLCNSKASKQKARADKPDGPVESPDF